MKPSPAMQLFLATLLQRLLEVAPYQWESAAFNEVGCFLLFSFVCPPSGRPMAYGRDDVSSMRPLPPPRPPHPTPPRCRRWWSTSCGA